MHGHDNKATLDHDILPTPREKLYAAMGLPPEAHARNWRALRHGTFGYRLLLAVMAGKVTPHARKVTGPVRKTIGGFIEEFGEMSLGDKFFHVVLVFVCMTLVVLIATLSGFIVYSSLNSKSSYNVIYSIEQAMRDEYGIGNLSVSHVTDHDGVISLLHGAGESECRNAMPAVERRLAFQDIIVRVACEGRVMTVHLPKT